MRVFKKEKGAELIVPRPAERGVPVVARYA